MPEALRSLLAFHPDRAHFPEGLFSYLDELGVEPAVLVPAWELSGLIPLEPVKRQACFVLALALRLALAQGHTRLALEPSAETLGLLRACGQEELDLKTLASDAEMASLVGRPGELKPLILEDGFLYAQRMRALEGDLASAVQALGARPELETKGVPETIFQAPVVLNAEQRKAVELSLKRSLVLITGGPGTGKTSIVVSILRALLCEGLDLEDIALAAPTGKAAQRMGEAIRQSLQRLVMPEPEDRPLLEAELEPRTLHRLLGWHPTLERFRHGAGSLLPARVLIVDEASMISQEQLARLMSALASDARLVLLGDADQLPSVEAGCAFRDLVERLADACIRLQESYRMDASNPEGRAILLAAQAIQAGDARALWEGECPIARLESLEALKGSQVECLDPGWVDPKAFLHRWFEERVLGLEGFLGRVRRVFSLRNGEWATGDEGHLRELFDHFDSFRILGALKDASDLRGVTAINALLHGWMLERTGEGLRGPTPFCAGEPVLMGANDYRRGIFNGDQGLVLKVRFEDQVRQAAVFPRLQGFVAFPLEPLRHQLEHAYAMTIHKSQGSEYARVALVLPRTNHKALTRELVYTGLTRAKRSVILVAEPERLAFAARNPVKRDSGLRERLGQPEKKLQ